MKLLIVKKKVPVIMSNDIACILIWPKYLSSHTIKCRSLIFYFKKSQQKLSLLGGEVRMIFLACSADKYIKYMHVKT
jgi:hypothetical protein